MSSSRVRIYIIVDKSDNTPTPPHRFLAPRRRTFLPALVARIGTSSRSRRRNLPRIPSWKDLQMIPDVLQCESQRHDTSQVRSIAVLLLCVDDVCECVCMCLCVFFFFYFFPVRLLPLRHFQHATILRNNDRDLVEDSAESQTRLLYPTPRPR